MVLTAVPSNTCHLSSQISSPIRLDWQPLRSLLLFFKVSKMQSTDEVCVGSIDSVSGVPALLIVNTERTDGGRSWLVDTSIVMSECMSSCYKSSDK